MRYEVAHAGQVGDVEVDIVGSVRVLSRYVCGVCQLVVRDGATVELRAWYYLMRIVDAWEAFGNSAQEEKEAERGRLQSGDLETWECKDSVRTALAAARVGAFGLFVHIL